MPTIKPVSEVLNLAKIAQYLAFNDQAQKLFLKGGSNARLPYMITCERLSVQWQYDTNPTDPTLRGTANYLYDLLGIYGIQAEVILAAQGGVAPIVTGPADQTITLGNSVSFTIGVTSSLAYTIAWYVDGVLATGETGLTYTFTPTLGQSGAIVNAIVTNLAGSTPSANAVLTVTTTITGQAYYGDTDYYSLLSIGVDTVPYQISFNITDQQPLSVTFPIGAANNKFEVIKYPASQGTKTSWYNTPFNNGPTIPDAVFRTIITIGSNMYIVSRVAISIDTTSPMVFS